jgi:predicted nuclease of predicted toxin-antitoxin system
MPRRFYKFKLMLDENMPPRQRFPRLNSRFDVKHIRDDLSHTGLKDPSVYALASKLNRLIITFNGDDFKNMVAQSSQTGVINVSANLRYDQIDTKLTSLLTKSSPNALFDKFTDLTGETEV